jgi:hypothetical protein
MSDFDLDIDSPFPVPEREVLNRKPQRLTYRDSDIRYKHYGRNIELLIDKVMQVEDPEEKEAGIIYLGKLMKSFYASWNRENVDDESILKNMRELSGNQLDYDLESVRQGNLFDSTIKEKKPRSNVKGKGRGGSQNRRRRN